MDRQQLEQICEVAYTTGDPGERRAAEEALRALQQQVLAAAEPGDAAAQQQQQQQQQQEQLPAAWSVLLELLAQSASPWAQMFAIGSVARCVSASGMPTARLTLLRSRLLGFVWDSCSKAPPVPNFVLNAAVQLLGRIMKLEWVHDTTFTGATLMQDVGKFTAESSVPHKIAGLYVLHAVVKEISNNQPNSGISPFLHKQIAQFFRDKCLLEVFGQAVTYLKSLVAQPAVLQSNAGLLEVALKLALQCLSFDFSGSGQAAPDPVLTLFTQQGPIALCLPGLDSSSELDEDVATVQIPSTWRPFFEDTGSLPLFFQLYALCQVPPNSVTAMECILQLVSVKRSIFSCESSLVSFYNTAISSLTNVMTSRTGLSVQENHHTFCRVLAQFKSASQITLMSLLPEVWPAFVSALVTFTVNSIKAWQWSPNSVHYILSLWAHMVVHLAGKRGKTATPVQQGVPRVVEAYIESRLESVSVLMSNPGLFDDPLASHDSVAEHLAFVPYIGRGNYEETRGYLTRVFPGVVERLQAASDKDAELPGRQLAWLVYIAGALIRGRFAARLADTTGVDAEVTSWVFRLMQLHESQWLPRVRRTSGSVFAKLDLAFLYFCEQFWHAYLREMEPPTALFSMPDIGITSVNSLLTVFITKILSSLKMWATVPEIVEPAISLFWLFASGVVTNRLMLDLDVTRQILANHTSQTFPFKDAPACSKHRVKLYSVLGLLLFTEEFIEMFDQFVQPFEQAVTYLLAQPPEVLATDPSRQLAIGLIRDLTGLVSVIGDGVVFGTFWEWLYPRYTPLLSRVCEACYADSSATVPLLKLVDELVMNRQERLLFEPSSPNSLLLFRELGGCLSLYLTRFMAVPAQSVKDPFRDVYKPARYCLEAVARVLGGGYLPVGVFVVYGDNIFTNLVAASLKLMLSLPTREVQQLPKLNKVYYMFLQVICGVNPALVCTLDQASFLAVMELFHDALQSVDTTVQELGCLGLDSVLSAYHRQRSRRSPMALAFEAHVQAAPAVLPRLLCDVFGLAVTGKPTQSWAVARPLLVLLLLLPNHAEVLTAHVATMDMSQLQPQERERLLQCASKLMAGVKDNLFPFNRDHLLQNLACLRPAH
eukprot:TRINITY_DN145_c1_g2_i1.p1 TRINITY_DN145_c1_g2~~TRINITY_DN145_c1_g2_i1.p1  ORF type:complete len:1107 (+),score=313.50 TRINITY_DN145_c1_g2_i1:197-3517(+)